MSKAWTSLTVKDWVDFNKDKILLDNAQLIVWAYEYYQKDKPSVSDAQYDGLYSNLLYAVKKYKWKPPHFIGELVGAPSDKLYYGAYNYLRKNNER